MLILVSSLLNRFWNATGPVILNVCKDNSEYTGKLRMTVRLLLAKSSGFSVKRPSSQRRAIACVVIEHISRSLEHSKTKNDTSSDTLAMVRSGISVIPSVMSFPKKEISLCW